MNNQFTLVMWPEVQVYMDKPGFEKNSHLVNDEQGLEEYGSSAYFINNEWLKSVKENDFVANTLVVILANMKNVFVPIELQDAFLAKCQENGINVNGGAIKIEEGKVTGQYYYI